MNKINKCTDNLVDMLSLSSTQYGELGGIIRAIAGKKLASCKDFKDVLKKGGIIVNGNDDIFARECFINAAMILTAEGEDDHLLLSMDNAVTLAKMKGLSCEKIVLDSLVSWVIENTGMDSDNDSLEDDYSNWGSSEEDDELPYLSDDVELVELENDESEISDEELSKWEDEVESDVEDAVAEEVQKEIDEEAKKQDSKKEERNKIKGYYYQLYSGVVSELSKRYTSLFESGYEVVKPAGVLTVNGLLSLSGNSAVEKNNIAIRNIYNIFLRRMNFTICTDRSNINIANMIYQKYHEDRQLIYFPYKLLEYAYGRMAPDGDEQNSENTYKKHSDAANWSAYCNSEVKKSLMSVIEASVVRFVISTAEKKGIDYFDDSIANDLRGYLSYLQNCLSFCLLMVEYKGKTKGYIESVYSFKVRVCDPTNTLGKEDLTGTIINEAFMGSTGEVPFSYKPRFEDNTFVKEYAHEFNHNSSQASPLFAYKAYQALQAQGVKPTWNNMVLGMFEDGSILKNGKHGVALENRLTHHMVAGSRAGKGVMTLNILASGIYSGKNIFYLDRKPDMASLFKKISPTMFVMNGGGYGEQYDTFRQFNNMNSMVNWANVPDYVCNILGCAKNWDVLGDLFYMRALKLIMGIIVARGDGQMNNPAFGGKEGVLLVVDEFKNFQENFSVIVEKMISKIPPCSYTSDLIKMQDGKIEESKFNKSYNNSTFYALTYLNSLVADLEFLSTRRDAGFNQAEIALSDIFVIGQHLGYGDMDFRKIRSSIADATSSDRYRSSGVTGLKGQVMGVSDSFPFSMVGFKTCDAFFGRNMEDGRSVYLAQTNNNSKAYGRLDDKASNFAYMATFTEDVRKDIVSGNVSKNVSMANGCTYFKPFLVLNDSIKGGNCVEGMFARCAGPNPEEPWITREELIAENPNQDGTYVNSAVGFEDYLLMMGLNDYRERLAKSGDIANHVVKNCLGYDGNWFEFITDLRPEWCFSIKDIVDGAKGIQPVLLNPRKNSIMAEFVRFNPDIFNVSGDDNGFEDDYGSVLDYMDESPDNSEEIRQYEMDRIFENDEGSQSIDEVYQSLVSNDEPIDLFDEDNGWNNDDFDEDCESEESVIRNTGVSTGEVKELKRRLEALGYAVTMQEPRTVSQESFHTSPEYSREVHQEQDGSYRPFGHSPETTFEEPINYNNTIESKVELINLITSDVIYKAGGLDEITSLKIMGGSLVINGDYYQCKSGTIFGRSIPSFLRSEINAGNVAKYFNYNRLKTMSRLRKLQIDSLDFAYDYVAYGLGYGSRISVDVFFADLHALQELSIGDRLFTRSNFKEQIKGDDVFYNPRVSTKLADGSEAILSKATRGSWQFTKNTFKSKDYGLVMKALGVTGGLAATAVTGGANLAVKGTRKAFNGIKTLGRSIKNVFDETKNI